LSIQEQFNVIRATENGKRESWCVLGILPCKLYESHDLEKQNQIY
jgi:hypothetical protein